MQDVSVEREILLTDSGLTIETGIDFGHDFEYHGRKYERIFISTDVAVGDNGISVDIVKAGVLSYIDRQMLEETIDNCMGTPGFEIMGQENYERFPYNPIEYHDGIVQYLLEEYTMQRKAEAFLGKCLGPEDVKHFYPKKP